MFGPLLIGEAPPGVCPNVVGEALFFNSEVLRCKSRFMSLVRLSSGIKTALLINSPIESSRIALVSEVHESTL